MRASTPAALALAFALTGCGGDPPDLLVITPFVDRAEVEIPAGGTLSRTLDVSGATVGQGTAEVILQHPAREDLTVTVTSPAGTPVVLGGAIAEGDDYHRYAVPLLAVKDEAAAGSWRLEIVDAGSSGPGTLVVWAVALGGG